MRRAIILLGLLGLACLAVLGLGAGRQAPGEPRSFQPGAAMRALGAMTAPFAPRLPFQQGPVSVAANMPFRWSIPPSGDPVRILRLTLQSGPLAEIRLCPRNSAVPCDVPAVCAVPRGGRPANPGACAQEGEFGPSVKVSARKEDGTLWILAPNGPAVLQPE